MSSRPQIFVRCLALVALIVFSRGRALYGQATPDNEVYYGLTAGVAEPDKLLKLYTELQIPEVVADTYIHSDYFGPGRIDWVHLKSGHQGILRMLFLPCSSDDDNARIYLYSLFENHWKLLDTREFDCHYDDDVSFELLNITSPRQYDVMVHHDCVAHGTGYLEQSVWLFRLTKMKLTPVLNETEVLHYFPAGFVHQRAHEDTSTFLPIYSGVIEQTLVRTTFDEGDQQTLSGTSVFRRTFLWDSGKSKFRRSDWTTIK